MKKIISIIILVVFYISVSAQDYKEYIKNVPGQDKYPEASAINVITKIDVTLNEDGSFEKHVFYIKKILNYKGKRKYSDVKIDYNANYSTIDLGECFTVRDTNRVPLPKEAVHNNETFMTTLSPEYINQRQEVINFPTIEPGDFVVLNYTLKSKPQAYFSDYEHMMEENPYLEKDLTIKTPKDVKLKYSFDNDKIKFDKKEGNNQIIYSWKIENAPLIKNEKNKPSYLIIGSPIFYSTVDNWSDASKILFKEFNSTNYKTDEVKDLAKKITSGINDNNDKLISIYNYIDKNFVFKRSMTDDKFTPQPVKKVLEQKYGSNKELTALFIAIADEAGVNSCKPVFVLSDNSQYLKKIREIPCRNFISKIAVYNDEELISFNKKDFPYAFANTEKTYLIVDDESPQIVEYKYNKNILTDKTVNIKLNEDFSSDANFEIEYTGKNDYQIRRKFKNETEKRRKIWFTRGIEDKSITVNKGPEFINIQNLNKPLKIKFNASIANYYTKQNNYIYFKLPEPEDIDLTMTGLTRENPYQINNNIFIKETYIIDNLPKGYKVIKPKNDINKTYKDEKVEMKFNISSKLTGNKLVVVRTIHIPQAIISKNNYPKFYKFISNIQKPMNIMTFLKE